MKMNKAYEKIMAEVELVLIENGLWDNTILKKFRKILEKDEKRLRAKGKQRVV